MKIEEKNKLAEKLKKDYKDYEEYTDKKGMDKVNFSLGEITVPKGLEDQYLKVVPNEGKNYLMFTLVLGRNQKLKEEQRKKRAEISKKKKLERNKLVNMQTELKRQLKEYLKSGEETKVKELGSQIGELETQIMATKLR